MKKEFKCALCKKQVKSGLKHRLEVDEWDGEKTSTGSLKYFTSFTVICEDNICKSCVNEIDNKINSMRK